ncbi:4-hydroxy-tetrahydrodipicolinate synthase [Ignavibacteria bacterium]|nr:4-hydroxy-tetrahydrodipicolinate synthase [Bacteroidota bacterium]MCZ2132414.1 4-hydroxy-tetrahydrodipicolinate synthase [Bacteroidota bacterium]
MKTHFKGTFTALVTPFASDGSIDGAALAALMDFQIASGIEGIVIGGSTGEAATMSLEEKISAAQIAVERSAGRVKIIVGTGTNDTRTSVKHTRAAKTAGADGALVVTPYYNKPTETGLRAHFRAISDAAEDMPIILYNVPSRTAQNVGAALQILVAEDCPNVVATKEASGNMEQIMEIIRDAPPHFSVLAGDDSAALPLIACGAVGVVSVISNYAPKVFGDCVRAALAADFAESRRLHYRLFPLMKANFIETNPIPVKTALSLMGYCEENYRLPLAPMQPANKSFLAEVLRNCGILN